MKHSLALAMAMVLAGSMSGCTDTSDTDAVAGKNKTTQPLAQADSAAAEAGNPFFVESPLPLHYPQFDKIKDGDFAPAFDRGMADHLKEVTAIADNDAAPSFDNTILALEKSGKILHRTSTVF